METYLVLTPAEQAEVRARIFPEGGESVEAVELTWADRLIQQGLERGIEQGALEAKRATVPLQLRARFGSVPGDLADRLGGLDEAALDCLLEHLVRAGSLDEFMAGLP